MNNFFLLLSFLLLASTVNAQENLALGKKTFESETAGGSSNWAVDGNTDGNYKNHSVTHTTEHKGAYWQVDLGAVYDIRTIKLYNRTDCCAERLDNYNILVTDDGNWYNATLFADHEPYSTETVRTFTGNRRGRWVRVRLNGTGYLSLAEVEVFGETNTQNESGQPSVGQMYEGSMICHVNADGKSGLVVTSDIGPLSLADAQQEVGGAGSAWRLTTGEELFLMLNNIGPNATGLNQNIGNFTTTMTPYRVAKTTDEDLTWVWSPVSALWLWVPDSEPALHRFVMPFRIE
jgi:hypothetical protein